MTGGSQSLCMPYALLVAGSPDGVGSEILRILASNASCVVAVDGGGDPLRAAEITPDLLIGDFDSISDVALAAVDAQVTEIVQVSSIKDESDLALALAVIARRGTKRVVLTHALGGRFDHTLAVLGALQAASTLAVDVIDTYTQIRFFSDEVEPRMLLADFCLYPGEEFSLFSLDDQALFTAEGVAYPAQVLALSVLGDRGVSNVVIDPSAYLQAHKGRFMLVRTLPLETEMLK